jgi:hypothetical protein
MPPFSIMAFMPSGGMVGVAPAPFAFGFMKTKYPTAKTRMTTIRTITIAAPGEMLFCKPIPPYLNGLPRRSSRL